MADGIRLMTLAGGVDPGASRCSVLAVAADCMRPKSRASWNCRASSCRPRLRCCPARGMLTSDLRYEMSRTHFETGARSPANEVRRSHWLEARATNGCAAGSTARSGSSVPPDAPMASNL